MVFLYSRYKTLYLAVWNFKRFLTAYFSSLSKSFSVAALPSSISITPPVFVVTHVLAKSAFVQSSRLIKTLNSFGPGVEPQGKSLVTNYPLDF